jgi:UDP-N-acetylglucosamine 2-epimerase (non-hydrolysing)
VSGLKVLVILGTRPEAIKLCPLIRRMRQAGDFDVRVCVTGQHREMLDQVLPVFQVKPDHDLGAMRPAQTLFQSTTRILAGLEDVIAAERPAMILVQGDTTTTLCGALAAFYAGIPAGHVEAGLRTGNMQAPYPEEMNRVLTGRLASVHFAATPGAAANLAAEGVPAKSIAVTGNTGIDALLGVEQMLREGTLDPGRNWRELDAERRLILVTAHRRESFGEGIERICEALITLARRPDVQIVYPVHPNPAVAQIVRQRLSDTPHILLIDPLDYVSFVDLMRRSYLLLTDSGGVQEEAPSLGKPVLVMRRTTERPEAVEAGTALLVGDDARVIVDSATQLLDDEREYGRRSRIHNPYGDGHASERIIKFIRGFPGLT